MPTVFKVICGRIRYEAMSLGKKEFEIGKQTLKETQLSQWRMVVSGIPCKSVRF